MNRLTRLGVGVAVIGAMAPTMISTAAAAPTGSKNATPLTLMCDNNVTYYAVVNGGGNGNSNSGQTYNPAHSVTDNSVLQPVAFGESTYSLYVNGDLVDQQTQPPNAKGNAGVPPNATPVNCSYTFQRSQTDPATGDVYTFVGSGTVTGFIPGSSHNG